MREFGDWRYLLVYGADWLMHKAIGSREVPPLCNLERRMYWRRKSAIRSVQPREAGA